MTDHDRGTFRTLAGSLMFIAGVIAILGIITSETLYPGYSTSANEISDLGSTRPPVNIIHQPSAIIFNMTMLLTGVLFLGAALCLHRVCQQPLTTLVLVVFGAGVLGVGIFPGNTGNPHALSALLAFVAGGLSAIVMYRVITGPFRYVSVILGAIALLVLLLEFTLGPGNPFAVLGRGGVERWIVYPIVLWVIGLGGYLLGSAAGPGRGAS